MIELQVNGINYEGFTSINVFRSIENISGSFAFTATSDNVNVFPIKVGQPCRVVLNNEAIITGFIEQVAVEYDSARHSITINGRDKTCDVIDSSAIGKTEFKAPISFQQIISTSLSDNGIGGISIINNAGVVGNFKSGEVFSASIGETLFSFFEKYARKRQVMLSTDGKGNIVLARAGSEQAIVALHNIINGLENNILSASVNYDNTGRFNNYIIESQQNPAAIAALGGSTSNENVVGQSGSAKDNKIRESRTLSILSNSSDSNVDLKQLATWHANLNRARSIQYSVNVQGFFQDKEQTTIWKPNTLVQVIDDFSSINAIMLIKSVNYSFDVEQGSITTIDLVSKDAYTLQANVANAEERVNKQGVDLIEV